MTISSNEWLTLEEMQINATYIYNKLISVGWTPNAIAGMLGNMQSESSINPGIWEGLNENNMSGGFGLVQWTPASKYTNWADYNNYTWGDIDGQINRILYEIDNNLQWYATSQYPYSFEEFSHSTKTPYELGLMFLACYERPANPVQPLRGEQANYWYTYLYGNVPPIEKRRLPIWMWTPVSNINKLRR